MRTSDQADWIGLAITTPISLAVGVVNGVLAGAGLPHLNGGGGFGLGAGVGVFVGVEVMRRAARRSIGKAVATAAGHLAAAGYEPPPTRQEARDDVG